MAGKVNYRFVAVLCAILVVCTLVVVGLWYTFVRTDPAENIARGDGAFESGLYARASALYGKALTKRPNDIDVLLKFADSVERIEVSDVRTARDTVQRLQAAYGKALEINPVHADAFERLMEMTLRIGRDLGDFDAWNQMVRMSTSSLAVDGTFTLARKYRGIAQVNMMDAIDVAPDERDQAREDLQVAAQAMPGDTEVVYHLVRWHLAQARSSSRSGNRPDEVSRHHLKALELAQQLLKHDPNDPLRQLYHIRVLTALEKHDQAMELFAHLEAQMLQNPQPADVVLAVADRIAFVTSKPQTAQPKLAENGLQRTEALLRAAQRKHESDLRFNTALGRTLTLQGRYDDAVAVLQTVMEKPIVATPVNLLRDADLQRRALIQNADLMLTRAREQGPEEQKATLARVEELIKKLKGTTGQSALVYLMEGKVLMVREQWAQALSKLDYASTMLNDQNPEALLYSATARIKLNEPGAAIDRLEQLVIVRPDYMPARYELMRLHLQLSQYDRLSDLINSTLVLAPDDRESRIYMGRMLARRGHITQAIQAFEALDPAAHPSVAAPLARLYVSTNQAPRALALLKQAFNTDPTNPNVLLMLIELSGNNQQAVKYLEQARTAGASDKVLKLFEQKIAGNLDKNRIASIEGLINEERDPFKRHTNRYRLYTGLGMSDKANTELSKLATLKPNDPLVVEARFDRAIKQRDWESAEQLARRAAADDLDLAQGSFYQGRLELARGQADLAMASFQRGLDKRSVYSRGWCDMADAQMAGGDVALAGASYRKALEQNPNNVKAVRGLVASLDAQGRHDQALREQRSMMLRGPEGTQLLDIYLNYEQQHGDPSRALQIRKRMAEKNPDDANNQRALAVMLAQRKDATAALQTIDNLISRQGQTRQNLYTKATVMNLAGQTLQARQMLQDYVNRLGDKAQEEDWIIFARFLMRTRETARGIAAYRSGIAVEDPKTQNASRELADQLFTMGDNQQAAELYAKMHQLDPEDQRIAYRYVESLIRANQTSQARDVLHKIVSESTPNASAYLLASVIARQEKDPQRAIEALDKAVELEPNRAIIYYERAMLRRSINAKDPKVRADLRQALTLDPDLSAARRQLTAVLLEGDDRASAIQELAALMQRHPNDASLRVQLAELYYADRQTMQLHSLLDDSMDRFPNEAIWPRMQGRLAKLEGRTNLAVRSFQRAFKLSPTADVFTELIEQLLEARLVNEALQMLRQHQRLIKDAPRVQALRGRALAVNGHTAQAKAVLAHALKQCARLDDVLNVSGQMLVALGRERGVIELEAVSTGNQTLRPWIQMAIAQSDIENGAFGQAVSRLHAIEHSVPDLSDDKAEYHRLLALALHKHGDYSSSAGHYRKVLEIDTDNVGVLNNFAYLLAESLGRPDEALEPATRAAQLAPQSPQVLDTLGWVQHLSGRQATAINTLRKSVHLQALPNNCYHLAIALRETGETGQAWELLMTARELAQKAQDHELLKLINQGMTQ